MYSVRSEGETCLNMNFINLHKYMKASQSPASDQDNHVLYDTKTVSEITSNFIFRK